MWAIIFQISSSGIEPFHDGMTFEPLVRPSEMVSKMIWGSQFSRVLKAAVLPA